VIDLDKAIAYVQTKGNIIEQARLASILWKKPPDKAVLQKLATMQNPDGGFSFWIKDFSTVCDTVYVLIWLDDLSIQKSPIVNRAINFLLSQQKEDGGWDEIEKVREANPPPFLVPGKVDTRIWLTAYCAHWFARFGFAEHPKVKAPLGKFLLNHRQPSGQLGSSKDLRATWDWLVLLSHHPGPDSEIFKQTLAVIEKGFSPEKWEGSYLAWLVCCLRDAELPAHHPFVERCLDELVKKQRPDGSWDSEDGEAFAANATIEALRVIKHYGIT